MKIWILSDLHREATRNPWTPRTLPAADLAIVAGDVGNGLAETVSWLGATIRPAMPVVLVPGNHEFYDGDLDRERASGRVAAGLQGVHLLDDDTITVAGCTVSGATLWTDYALDPAIAPDAAMALARRLMMDHHAITATRSPAWRGFTPKDAASLHRTSRGFLDRALTELDPPEGRVRPHVVVTHHAPSARSIAPAYAGNSLNPAFASDLEPLIRAGLPDLWVHGHVHSSFDYRIGSSRIVCNPRGYGDENPYFDPLLVVDIPA